MTYVVLLGVVVVQGLVVQGWHRVLDVPGRAGGLVVATGTALTCDVLVWVQDGQAPLAPVPAVLGVAMLASVVQQMLRRDGRGRLNASLAATATLAVVVAVAVGYLAAVDLDHGTAVVGTVALAAGSCALVPALGGRLGLPGWAEVLAGPALAVAAGAACGLGTPLTIVDSLALAAAAAAAATAGGALAARAPRPRRAVAAGLSFATAGPLAYVMGAVLIG